MQIPKGHSCWIGTEQEGRLKGIRTLFAVHTPINSLNACARVEQCFHVYLTRRWIGNHLFCSDGVSLQKAAVEDFQEILCGMLLEGYIFTLELDDGFLKSIPPDIRIRCHIILKIQVKDYLTLKETDTISIGPSADLGLTYNCRTATLENFSKHSPPDYSGDHLVTDRKK